MSHLLIWIRDKATMPRWEQFVFVRQGLSNRGEDVSFPDSQGSEYELDGDQLSGR